MPSLQILFCFIGLVYLYKKLLFSMNVETLRLQIINEITDVRDVKILNQIRAILTKNEKDWWDELSTEEKASLDVGIDQIVNRQTLSHTEVRNRFIPT